MIQRVERPTQPSMTIQSLCSAIRSQLHFSQISAWSDLLEQQYTDYAFYQEHILKNPRITMNWGTSRPVLDLLYRVKCASQKGTFERAPMVHNFPNVVLDVNTGLAVSLRSLPRLERIPRLSVENKKLDGLMMEGGSGVLEKEILPGSSSAGGVTAAAAAASVCCQEKGKHRCWTYDEWQGGKQKGGGESSQNGAAQPGDTLSGGDNSLPLSHREKQLLKYKKRLQKRDKGGGSKDTSTTSTSSNATSLSTADNNKLAAEPSVTSINDLRLPPMYTPPGCSGKSGGQLEKAPYTNIESQSKVAVVSQVSPNTPSPCLSQDVATQTDLQLSVDDELVEMDVDSLEGEEQSEVDDMMMLVDELPLSPVTCQTCNKQMRLVCGSQSCDSKKRLQQLRNKYRNAMVAKRMMGSGGRLLYKVPKSRSHLWSLSSRLVDEQNGNNNNNNVAGMVNRNVEQEKSNSLELGPFKNTNNNNNYFSKSHQIEFDDNKVSPQQTKVTEFTSLCNYVDDVEKRAAVDLPVLFRSTAVEKKEHANHQLECYHTPTATVATAADLMRNKTQSFKSNGDSCQKAKAESDASFQTMKLCKLDHETVSLKRSAVDFKNVTPTAHLFCTAAAAGSSSSSLPNAIIKTSVHCVKNLTSIFTNATEAAAAVLVKPPTPQVMLKRLNLYTAAVAAQQQQDLEPGVFNFDLEESGEKRTGRFAIKKSLSTPSAVASDANSCNGTANSLSPRFLKSASAYNKKQKRSRHLSDRSSERSSVCSDELSLSDDEALLLTPNGSNLLLLTSSPVLPTRRLLGCGVDGKAVGGSKGSLFKSAFGNRPLLGSIEENMLQRRLTPKYLVSGFRVLLGASGGFCPKQLTIPAKTFFYELSGQSQTTPYMVSEKNKYRFRLL